MSGGSCCGSAKGGNVPTDPEHLVEAVRDRYGRIARDATLPGGGSCCGGVADAASAAQAIGYREADLALLPEGTNLGLGCGAPVAVLDPQPGETVLDLGSGAGIDVFLAARAVGPTGHVIGVDMTPDMLAQARRNAANLGFAHVEFREGRLEALPVDDASVDAVTSNCVINLVPDKSAVFREVARVLRPGGRLVVSDIVLDAPLPAPVAADVLAYVGCVAGAMLRQSYFALLADAGLGDVEVLRDVDYLAAADYVLLEEVRTAMAALGQRPEDLTGKVRSVTYRARKPGP
jgi:arsenite methyltransferase